MLLAGVCVASGYTTARLFMGARDHLRTIASDSSVIELEGTLLENWQRQKAWGMEGAGGGSGGEAGNLDRFVVRGPGWSSAIAVSRVGAGDVGDVEDSWRTCSGRVRVLVSGEVVPAGAAGERVRAMVIWEPREGVMNPGEERFELFAQQDQDAGRLRSSSAELVWVTQTGGIGSVRLRAGGWLRDRLQRVLDGVDGGTTKQPSAARRLLGALLLGEREFERTDAGLAYTRLGLSHILSISGFHLTVLALSVLWVLRLTGDRGWVEPALVGALIGMYVLALPAQAPIVRSAMLVLGIMLAESLGRRYDRVCVLGWITIALLAWRPADLWSLGFQLSVGLTALLLWVGEGASRTLFGGGVRGAIDNDATRGWFLGLLQRARNGMGATVATSAMCWTASLPIVAQATGMVSLMGVVASVLLAPLFVVMLWLGYATLLLGLIVPALAPLAGGLLGWLCGVAIRGAAWLDGFALASLRVPPLPMWWALLASVWVIVGWRCMGWWGLSSRRWWWAYGVGVFALLLPSLVDARAGGLPSEVVLRIDAISVGDGTCMLVRSGRDAMLWDAKAIPPRSATPRVAMILRELGVWRVGRIVITHPDIDHMSGVLDLIEPLGVREVLVSARFIEQARLGGDAGAAGVIMADLAKRGVGVRAIAAGDEVTVGPARMTVVSPPADAVWPADNEHSVVGLLEVSRAAGTTAQPVRVLLTGDAGPRAIEWIMQAGLPAVDAIELPHHGSAQPEAMRLVEAVRPGAVLQSTGPSRLNDPRWQATREQVEGAGGRWMVTARHGWIGASWLHDGSVRIQSMRHD